MTHARSARPRTVILILLLGVFLGFSVFSSNRTPEPAKKKRRRNATDTAKITAVTTANLATVNRALKKQAKSKRRGAR